jgi:bacterioferritin (cytochrome b1)
LRRATVQEFIARENIKRFRRQLENCTDDRQRDTLKVLLASEQAHLERLEDEHAKLGTTRPHPE